MQRNSWEKQYPALKKILLMTYNAEKKNLTLLHLQRFGRKLLQTSNGHVNHLGSGGRNGFDTSVNAIHQQNGWRAFIKWWF